MSMAPQTLHREPTDLLLRGGRVIDTSGLESGGAVIDQVADVLIQDGRIARIGSGLAAPSGGRVIDVRERLVVPGLVDLHVHFREPGHEYKEDIESGGRSAAAGGFTTVCCMPNTNPVNDCRSVTELIVRRAQEVGRVRVRPIGAISRGLKGKELAEFGDMKDAGIVAVSDDGLPVMSAGLMRRALEYARTFDLPVIQHAEDLSLAEGGVMNEGLVSTRLGLKGQPAEAESTMVARDVELTQITGARYHVAHISAARSVDMVREAKRRGLAVTCEVTPHHLVLTDEACVGYDTDAKVMPPLRSSVDVEAVRQGLADGTIDCVATDHAPHSLVEKDVEFACASPGMIGLETAVPLVFEMVSAGVIDYVRAVRTLTSAPARVFGFLGEGTGTLRQGAPADVAVLDPDVMWTVEDSNILSRSKNTPFAGRQMRGAAVVTCVAGRLVYERGNGE